MAQRPSIRQLECAVAVAEHRHFGRAARACFITQPALSAQIRGLEDLLGVALFERSKRGAAPTPAGEELVERAKLALRAVDDVASSAASLKSPWASPLHIGAIPTVAPFYLPGWLARIRRAHPELRVYLHEDRTEAIVAKLREGALDLLLLALPIEGDDLESLTLLREPFVLAAPSDHPLARDPRKRVAEGELRGAEMLLLEDGHCLREQALAVCRHNRARERDDVRASSLTTLVQMVAGGLGATLLPEGAAPLLVRPSDKIALRRFRDPVPVRKVGLLWRRNNPRAAALRTLAELFPIEQGRAARA